MSKSNKQIASGMIDGIRRKYGLTEEECIKLKKDLEGQLNEDRPVVSFSIRSGSDKNDRR